jgi:putative copper resistance protein D
VEIGGWDIAAAFAKAVIYAATLGASGAVFFTVYCGALLRDNQRALIRRLIGVSVVLGAAASVLRILLLCGSMGDNPASMFDASLVGMILGGGEGRATGMRITGLILTSLAISKNPLFRAPAIVGALIASTSFAWTGHVHALSSQIAPTLLLCLHLLCAAFWLGALAPLRLIAAAGNEPQIAAAAARFGALALRVVALLLAAGASLLWMLIGDAAQFWRSGYGCTMAAKLLAVALILSLAAWNKLSLTPKLLKRQTGAVRSFRRSLSAEIFFAALILTVTAALTTLSGPP